MLFGLSGAFAPVVLLSLVGGYPVGARAIADLYRGGQVSRKQAERAALFCVGSGPAFLISFVGSALYGSEEIGLILLCSQVLAVMLSGIALRMIGGKISDNSEKELRIVTQPFSAALVEATRDASAGMAAICGLVVLFAAFTGICEELLPACDESEILLSLLDVSTGVCRSGRSDGAFHPPGNDAVRQGGGCLFDRGRHAGGFLRRERPLGSGAADGSGRLFVHIQKTVTEDSLCAELQAG